MYKRQASTGDNGLQKEETVYVNTTAGGEVTDVAVSDWLKNSGDSSNSEVKDASDLDVYNRQGMSCKKIFFHLLGGEKVLRVGENLSLEMCIRDRFLRWSVLLFIPFSVTRFAMLIA